MNPTDSRQVQRTLDFPLIQWDIFVFHSWYARWEMKGISFPRRLNHETAKEKRKDAKKRKE